MRRPRRLLLPLLLPLLLLLLSQTATYGASGVPLKKRDSLHPDPDWAGKGYYRKSDGLYCQKCPAGTYIAEECKEQNGSGRCEPCAPGEYMEYPNALLWCQDCSKCREDQVEQSPCQPTRNTMCVCKNGTFCPPEHPCEMCQKCRTRCPEGQVVQKACTPESDLQCGPAPATGPSYRIIIIVILAVLVIVCVLGFCFWKCLCGSTGDGTPSSSSTYEMVSSMFRKLPWYRSVNVGAEDNATNAHLQNQQGHTQPLVMPSGGGSPKRSLVPAPGNEPIVMLRRSFYTFAAKVPKAHWKKFGRRLDLEENDVVTDTSEDGFFDMLNKWLSREGSKASVNSLLSTLDQLQLRGVAEDISSVLVQEGLYQYESS